MLAREAVSPAHTLIVVASPPLTALRRVNPAVPLAGGGLAGWL
jgi:hypothetical protein